jgi:hypothetical protein
MRLPAKVTMARADSDHSPELEKSHSNIKPVQTSRRAATSWNQDSCHAVLGANRPVQLVNQAFHGFFQCDGAHLSGWKFPALRVNEGV